MQLFTKTPFYRALTISAIAFSLAACDDDTASNGKDSEDAAVINPHPQTGMDAGVTPVVDSGVQNNDSGVQPNDSGVQPNDSGVQPSDSGVDIGEDSGGLPDGGDYSLTVEGGSTLLFNQTLTLTVKYNENGRPGTGVVVAQILENNTDVTSTGAHGTRLNSYRQTLSNGQAKFTLTSGNQETTIDIIFTVGETSYIYPVAVRQNPAGEIKARIQYRPSIYTNNAAPVAPDASRYLKSAFTNARVVVTPSCTDWRLQYGENVYVDTTINFTGDNSVVLPGLSDGKTVAVAAVAWGEPGVEIAEACVDGIEITGGVQVAQTIALEDMPLNFKQTLASDQTADLTEALSSYENNLYVSTTGKILAGLGQITSGVQGEAAACGTDENTGATIYCPNGKALMNLLFEYLDVNAILQNLGLGETFAAPIATVIEGLATSNDTLQWLQGYYNQLPENITLVLTAIGDVYDILSNLHTTGNLSFDQETPTVTEEDGTKIFTLANNVNQWTHIHFYWELACDQDVDPENCFKTFSFAELGMGNSLNAFFDAELVTGKPETKNRPYLKLGEHTLNLKFGELGLAVIERWLLPWIMKTGMSEGATLEAFFGQFLPCEWAAEKLCTPSSWGFLGNKCVFADAQACIDTLAPMLAEKTRDALKNIDQSQQLLKFSGETVYLDQTPDLALDTLQNHLAGTDAPYNMTGTFAIGESSPVETFGTLHAELLPPSSADENDD